MNRFKMSVRTRALTVLSAAAAVVSLSAFALVGERETTVPKADADLQLVLDAWAGLQPIPLVVLTPEEARRQPTLTDGQQRVLLAAGRDTTSASFVPGVTTVERTIPGAAGPLPATVYTPRGGGAVGPLPVIVFFHGGGWVIANRKVYDGGARGLAGAANAIVVSVDYRRGPEHRFPAAHDDAIAAYRWVTENARSINGDSMRVALAGESAGGNLAVATAIAARDMGLQRPVHVISVYPVAQPDTTTPSFLQNANAIPLDRATIPWFLKYYLRQPSDVFDPRISLVRADLHGLPGVTIINAEIDPLRTDGALLEEALRGAGVDVDRRVYTGATHEFFHLIATVQDARDAQAYAASRLRSALGSLASR